MLFYYNNNGKSIIRVMLPVTLLKSKIIPTTSFSNNERNYRGQKYNFIIFVSSCPLVKNQTNH